MPRCRQGEQEALRVQEEKEELTNDHSPREQEDEHKKELGNALQKGKSFAQAKQQADSRVLKKKG